MSEESKEHMALPRGAVYQCKSSKLINPRKGEGRDAAIKRVCGTGG